MSASPAVPYGEVIKDYRKRLGISQDHIATITNEDVSRILELEARNAPPSNPAFYPRLLQGTGCINLFVQSVLQAAEVGSSTEELEKLIAPLIEPLLGHPTVAQIFRWRVTAPEEPAQDTLTEFSQIGASISEREALNDLKEYPLPIHYLHTSVPDHAPRLVDEGKFQKEGAVFDRSDAKLFFEALGNPKHKHKDEAEAALQGFSKAVEKTEVTSLNRAASKYHISVQTLSEWVAKELIPYECRDKNAIYLAEEITQEVARDNEEAKAMGMQTARLLRERHDKYFPSAKAEKPPKTHGVAYERGRTRDKTPQEQQSTESSEHLITLAEASEIFGIPVGTLSSYIHEGKLTRRGRQRSPAPGGGKVLIDPTELDSFLSSRNPKGRPKKNPGTANSS